MHSFQQPHRFTPRCPWAPTACARSLHVLKTLGYTLSVAEVSRTAYPCAHFLMGGDLPSSPVHVRLSRNRTVQYTAVLDSRSPTRWPLQIVTNQPCNYRLKV